MLPAQLSALRATAAASVLHRLPSSMHKLALPATSQRLAAG
uniref:Uncharacterized protein n=1 Tax=Peronospora matthiolae TaxID=2874970 RepID=A0AAV1TVF6_9STRA